MLNDHSISYKDKARDRYTLFHIIPDDDYPP